MWQKFTHPLVHLSQQWWPGRRPPFGGVPVSVSGASAANAKPLSGRFDADLMSGEFPTRRKLCKKKRKSDISEAYTMIYRAIIAVFVLLRINCAPCLSRMHDNQRWPRGKVLMISLPSLHEKWLYCLSAPTLSLLWEWRTAWGWVGWRGWSAVPSPPEPNKKSQQPCQAPQSFGTESGPTLTSRF